MQIAVMADIHGNLPALEAVLKDLQGYSIDGVIIAGDLIGGGPQPVETLQSLRSLNSWMISGNADQALLQYAAGLAPPERYTCHPFALLRWLARQVDQETLNVIKALPEQRVVALANTAAIRVVHGSPRRPTESILPDHDPKILQTVFAQIDEPVLICGHTHIPWQVEQNGRLAFNPGAVSGPLNGVVGAQYALLTWQAEHWQVKHITIPYDLERIRNICQSNHFLEEGGAFARAFLLCLESGHDVLEDFFRYAQAMTLKAGYPDSDRIPDDIWDQATRNFAWSGYDWHHWFGGSRLE